MANQARQSLLVVNLMQVRIYSHKYNGDGSIVRINLHLLLTRRQYMSHSGLQENAGSRRGLQVMVIPLAKAATRSRHFLATPDHLILNKKGPSMPVHGQRYQHLL